MFVIICGIFNSLVNPVTEVLEVIGPFNTYEEADDYAMTHATEEWDIWPIISPKGVK